MALLMAMTGNRRHHDFLVTLPLLFLLLLQQPAVLLAYFGQCGVCFCEQQSINCDGKNFKDRIRESSIRLEKLLSTVSDLRKIGLDPTSFDDLYINCKNSPLIQSQRLTKEVLSAFTNLKKIVIIKCGVTAIDTDAFQLQERLEELDVSDNNIGPLSLRVFSRQKMKLLKLSENRQLRLEADPANRRISLQRLILTKCDLTEFPTAALESMDGLSELIMSENQIRFVPRTALTVVRQLKLFIFNDNPLECTCANKWLRESVNWDTLSPLVMRTPTVPTCKSPFSLMDVQIPKVEPSHFLCTPPRISSVDVLVERNSAVFACDAQADERNDQPLAWFYQRSLPAGLGVDDIINTKAAADRGTKFHRRVQRTPGVASEQFAVRVENSDGQSATFNLTIAWPPELPQLPPPQLPQAPLEAGGGGASPSTEDSPPVIPEKTAPTPNDQRGQRPPGVGHQPAGEGNSNKQFTLLEMIIAVIGTFMSTSLVFLLACQFVRWYKRRDKKLWASYAHHHHQQQQQPSGPHPQYSATYNYNPHPGSSHEYDVPRIDQPCLPKPPPPPPMSQLPQMPHGTLGGTLGGGGGSSMSSSEREFLDYNNPRLMYNV